MVVAIGLLAILAALMIPALRGRAVSGDAAGLATTLGGLRQGIQNYRAHTGFYPSSAFQLVSVPGQQNAPLTNSCGPLLPAAVMGAAWNGPYVAQQVGVGGIQSGAMEIAPAFSRDTVTGDLGSLRINVLGVPQPVAEIVDAAFDGGAFSATSGTITWADTGSTPGVLVYRIPVKGC